MIPPVIVGAILSLVDGFAFLISYVSGNQAFPPPLSSDEEERLLRRLESGDTTARNILIERNLRLVAHIVKKFDNTHQDTDDLISIGTIGLIKAINTFNRHKKTRLATYAARCIENEILMDLRAAKKQRGEMRLFEPIGADKEGNELALLDILESDVDVEDDVERRIEREAMIEKLRGLSPREKMVLELRFGLKGGLQKTQREISRALGISRSYVSRIEKRAISKLHAAMAACGFRP